MKKVFLAMTMVLAMVHPVWAAYPEKPIEVIVPSPPGGGTDIAIRLLAEVTEPFLKQKLVVVNKPGGGGTLGVSLLTQAKPDGYTLAGVWNSPLTASPHTLQVAFTPDDYQPILQISSAAYVLCAAPDFPANNARELIEELKKNPGKYTYGNDGVGGTMQLAGERIFKALGVKVRPVPFGGAGETAKNFLGGHVTFYGGSVPPIMPHIKAGKAKALLLTSAADNAALPTASGLKALGIPQEETVLWRTIIAPKGVPAEVLKTLEAAFRQGASQPRFKEFLKEQGEELVIAGPAEVNQLIREEYKALGEVAKDIGLKK
ncbi:MAG: tripartite tricarboxylate transporter substrate binding protein [Deltaproteobacteria bacterium]|nr:tripartite tricarboxylate transporter substrate binding protein [Deltaproteobacteria bacterium]